MNDYDTFQLRGDNKGFTEHIYYKDDKPHKLQEPAWVIHYPNGGKLERWFVEGQLHRKDGPAYVCTHSDGFRVEKWFINDKLHNLTNPALVYQTCVGSTKNKIVEEWYIQGIRIDPLLY